MAPRLSRLILLAASLVFLLAAFLPYVFAADAAADTHRFGGFLLNPVDGNTYLAKMQEGWRGAWRFTLPYSAEKGEGAYLFLFYIFLGHLSRWLSLPLLWTFHAARFLGAVALLFSVNRFCSAVLPDRRQSLLAFVLAAAGSGMGWLAALFGGFTSDFWVAEAYPFLSSFANPHFPIGLALLLWILAPGERSNSEVVWSEKTLYGYLQILRLDWWIGLLALLLAMVAPFGVVIALAVLLGATAWSAASRRGDFPIAGNSSRLFWTGLGGLPILAYELMATARDEQLRLWNAQNLTPSPSPGDLVVSFSPLLLLAFLGCAWLLVQDRRRRLDGWSRWRLPLIWLAAALLILYIPLNLQRRFIMGLYIPLAVLAIPGINLLSAGAKRRSSLLVALVMLLTLPTILVILLAARNGVEAHDPRLYLTLHEAQAMDWLRAQTPEDALVLAAPDTGLFIPAWSGRGVLYGHPFETVNAAVMEQAVLGFFSSQDSTSQMDFLSRFGIDYVFYGPRERSLGWVPDLPVLQPAFESGSVIIEAVNP